MDLAVSVAPLLGTVVRVAVQVGDEVHEGQTLVVIESMKMEHVVAAEWAGTVTEVLVETGETVDVGAPLVTGRAGAVDGPTTTAAAAVDLDAVRPDLAEVLERHALGLDAARPESVERRRRTGQRTTRENVADLCDE